MFRRVSFALFRREFVALLLLGITACEHIDFGTTAAGDTDDEESVGSIVAPTKTGQGTQEAPYTVRQVQEKSDSLMGKQVWVIGYAVGEAYRYISNSTFEAPFESSTNLLLASDSLCQDAKLCLPIEFTTVAQRSAMSLAAQPQHHRHGLMVQGTVERYFTVTGLRKLGAHQWFSAFFIQGTSPAEWEEEHLQY